MPELDELSTSTRMLLAYGAFDDPVKATAEAIAHEAGEWLAGQGVDEHRCAAVVRSIKANLRRRPAFYAVVASWYDGSVEHMPGDDPDILAARIGGRPRVFDVAAIYAEIARGF